MSRPCSQPSTPRIEIVSLCPRCGARIYQYESTEFVDYLPFPPHWRSDGYDLHNLYDDLDLCQCPECGGYFMKEALKEIERHEEERKPLLHQVRYNDYDSLREAMVLLDFDAMPPERRRELYKAFIHSYNSNFFPPPSEKAGGTDDAEVDDEDDEDDLFGPPGGLLRAVLDAIPLRPTKDEYSLFRSVVIKLRPLLGDDMFLEAELLREVGEFRQALVLLEELRTACELPPQTLSAVETAVSLCRARDTRPFVLPVPDRTQVYRPKEKASFFSRLLNKFRTLRKK